MDRLLDRGLSCVSVLDVSGVALGRARSRLGDEAAARVRWIEADVTSSDWSPPAVDLWHDRAVFHFLTTAPQRASYVARLRDALKTAGALVVATFALDGPERCSGLPVMRYSAQTLLAELGPGFELVQSLHVIHHTPTGTPQSFTYGLFTRTD